MLNNDGKRSLVGRTMTLEHTPIDDSTMKAGTLPQEGPLPFGRRWGPWLAAGLIVLAGVAVYWNSFAGVFVFDDFTSIIDNPTIRQWWRLDQVFRPPCDKGETVAGRPLLNFSLAVNYAISGTKTWSYHLVNLALHLFNGVLLFDLLRRTLQRPALPWSVRNHALWLAVIIAGLWTVHPLQTESVTYIVERAEAVVALFYLLTLYCVLRSVESSRSGWWKTGAVVACVLGMASKEVMVTAPVITLVYDRTFLAGSFGEAWRRRRKLYWAMAATWLLLVGLVLSTGLIFGGAESWIPPRGAYLLTQPKVILQYLRLAAWPYPQHYCYHWPVSKSWQDIWPSLSVVLVCGIAALWAMRRRPMWGFLGMWFFGILAPTSSIVPLRDVIVERRMYLPLIAVLATTVLVAHAAGLAGVRRGWMSARTSRVVGASLVAVVAVALGMATVARNRIYQSELAIWEDTVRSAPNNARAQNSLGLELAKSGNLSKAIEHCQEAMRLTPDDAEVHTNLANALASVGRLPEAIEHYEEALRLNPDCPGLHANLGNALTSVGTSGGSPRTLPGGGATGAGERPGQQQPGQRVGPVRASGGIHPVLPGGDSASARQCPGLQQPGVGAGPHRSVGGSNQGVPLGVEAQA